MQGPFFEQYQHIPRVQRLTKGLSSAQRSALLETTPLFTNGYISSPFFSSRADLQRIVVSDDSDFTPALTKSLESRPFCFSCGKIAESPEALKACSRCKTAQYCSVSCQKKDWKLTGGGGQHKSICEDLYEDLMTRQITGDVVRTVLAEGNLLDDIRGRFPTKEAQQFNEKFGTWREFSHQSMHLILSACLEKATKFHIDPVTTLELTSTRFLLEEVPGGRNEDMFRIIYVDQVSSDLFVSRARAHQGSMDDRVDIFQHLLASTAKVHHATTSDVREAQAPGVGKHAVQFFFAGKPFAYFLTMRYEISKIIGCRMHPFPDPIFTLDKLIGICNRGTLTFLKTVPKVLGGRDYRMS